MMSVAVFVVIFIAFVWFAVRAVRWAKKGGKASAIVSAAAFPFPDQPPPQEQVDQENRLKKDDDSGDGRSRQ